MPTRNGKIANLPNDIREQLNLRLLDGETGRELAAWLNALPEVQSVLGSQFNASPISEVNLTLWRQGGYLQWLTERECFDSARALADGDDDLAKTGFSAERLLNVLTLRIGQLLMRWDCAPGDGVSEADAFSEVARKARILQGISRSLLAIHRIQSRRSNSPVSLKNGPLITSPTAGGAAAPKPPLPSHPPIAGESCAEPRAGASSHDSPESVRASSPRPVTLSNSAPGLPAAAFHLFPAPHGRVGVRPAILSGLIAPSSISSILSHTPFKPDLDLAEILHAV